MVTRYDVIRGRWSSYFLVKMLAFQLVSTTKAKPVDKIKQRTYLCVILPVKHKQLPILSFFNLIFILGKIQDGGQDYCHVW